MLKRIIFDLDETILLTSKDAIVAYSKFLNKYNLDYTGEELYDALEELVSLNVDSIDGYFEFLKNYLDGNLTQEMFVDFINFYINENTFIDPNTISVLNYLKNKYELVILTNWFSIFQNGKLKKCCLRDFFTNIYCIDDFGKKPNEDVFIRACKPYLPNECAMVGDSINSDVSVPKKLGMQTFYLGNNSEYKCIDKISDLVNIL